MKPTPGNWTYNEDDEEVQYLALPLAQVCWGEDTGAENEVEMHANGYLMAAAPQLRDELANLSRAVRGYFDTREHGTEDDLLVDEHEMEVMLQRAERALETIFPPGLTEHTPECAFHWAQENGLDRPWGACDCGYTDHDDD